tara:strand:+ start:2410 stop:2742 length:333 start_codon:yes stop_codon:yes gene_type:complete
MSVKEKRTLYTTEYGIEPKGCGTITYQDGSMTLVQYKNCRPKVRENIYKEIVYIDDDFGENYTAANESLISILKERNVNLIYDANLAYDMQVKGTYFTLDKYIEYTRFYY